MLQKSCKEIANAPQEMARVSLKAGWRTMEPWTVSEACRGISTFTASGITPSRDRTFIF